MKSLEEVVTYLRANPFKYIVHLKMLEAYPNQITWHVEEVGDQAGIVLLLPSSVSPFDAKTYPTSDRVVLLAAADPAVADRLVQHLPRQSTLIFKLVDDLSKAAVFKVFPARRMTAFISYTTRAAKFPPDPDVVVSTELDERLIPCYQANGYTLPELTHFFRQGALSFSLYAGDPLATCLVFKNYEQIWEIGGVYTDPAYRRQGLAKRVVVTAINTLLNQKKIPRYQVVETNVASLKLAENLDLERFVTTEHYLYRWE
jgi:RimJ/RimL family protein N-acetyltransferase